MNMPCKIAAILAAATMLICFPARAHADEVYKACLDKSDGTNTAWAGCGAQWVEREDGKLNAAWKRLYAELDGQTKIDLLAEQRAWNAYKETSCVFYTNGDWGREGDVLDYFDCRANVIAARTRELDAYLKSVAPG